MSAWGCGTLENDDAHDLLREVVTVDDGVELVHESLAAAVAADAGDWLEAHDAAAALAAAELVAAARGAPSPELAADAVDWAGRHRMLAMLANGARCACRAVLGRSELAEMWEESGAAAAWKKAVEDLEVRLA